MPGSARWGIWVVVTTPLPLERRVEKIWVKLEVPLEDSKLDFAEILSRESRDTDVTFLGLKLPEEEGLDDYADILFNIARGNSSFIFVRNASQYRGKLIS